MRNRHFTSFHSRTTQQGVFLIEALVAILIFTLGILAMVGTGAMGVATQSDAQYRGEAARFAAELVNEIYPNVVLTNDTTVKASLLNFIHQPTGSACAFTGSAAASSVVTDWATRVQAAGSGLPGSGAGMQQVLVDTTAAGLNRIQITICWKAPSDVANRNLVYVGYIN